MTTREDVEKACRAQHMAPGYVGTANDACRIMRALLAERDALAAFKAYVHQRLDEAGIPTHPEGKHSAEGCRVGDRLDIFAAERDAAVQQAAVATMALNEVAAERDAARDEAKRLHDIIYRHCDPMNMPDADAAVVAEIGAALARGGEGG